MKRRWKWFSRCPVCAAKGIRFVALVPQDRLTGERYPGGIFECQHCGISFLNPQPIGDLSWLYPASYLSQSEEASGLAAWYRVDQYDFDFHLWERSTGKSISTLRSYLDIGSGSGERVAFAKNRGVKRVKGIDRYDQSPVAAKKFLQNTEVEKYFPKEKYQVVGLFHVLEHVSQPKEMLQHIHDVILAPGGELILQVPNYGSWERVLFGCRWFGLDVPRHFWHFRPRVLKNWMEEIGFEVLVVEQKNAWLHPVTTIASIVPEFDIQRIWVERGKLSTWKYWWRFLGWAGGTVLTMPWGVFLSVFGQGTMLTVVGRKRSE